MSNHLKRGNLLWEGSRMMLPEHKKALVKRKIAQQKIKKPHLDEQQLEKINRIICEALTNKRRLRFTYYDEGEFKLLIGYVYEFARSSKTLCIADEFGKILALRLEGIVDCDEHV